MKMTLKKDLTYFEMYLTGLLIFAGSVGVLCGLAYGGMILGIGLMLPFIEGYLRSV